MSQNEFNHKKEVKLKTSVGELIGPFLRQLKLVQDSIEKDPFPMVINLHLHDTIKNIRTLVEKTGEQFQSIEKLERRLIGILGKIEREIDYWKENKEDEEKESRMIKLVNQQFNLLKEILEKLRVPSTEPHEEESNVTSGSTQSEVGESSNNSKQEDDGWIQHPLFMRELKEVMSQPHLQNFLQSLLIFPENKELKKRLLVYWWMGLGIVSGHGKENKTDEEVGEEYFSELVQKGVLKPVFRKHNEVVDLCIINPQIHGEVYVFVEYTKVFRSYGDLAFKCVCAREAEEGGIWYLYENENDAVEALLNLDINYLNSSDIISRMKRTRQVQVLRLGRWQYPKSDQENKQSSKYHIDVNETDFLREIGPSVRYLSLRGISGITELPKSIGKLENLRILDLRSCHNLECLPQKPAPKKLRKMMAWVFPQPKQKWFDNLTHLDISECHLFDSLPKWICELSDLQVLKGFVVGSFERKTQFCQLSDLSKLKKLKKLSIKVAARHYSPADFSGLKPLENLLVLTIIWRIDNKKDSRDSLSNGNSAISKEKNSDLEKQDRDNAEDSTSNISQSVCEQIPKGHNVVQAEQQSRENTSSNITHVEDEQIKGVNGSKGVNVDKISVEKKPNKNKISRPIEGQEENRESSISFPRNLEKLDMRCYPHAEAPELLNPANLGKLKRLYIRGGNLAKIGYDAKWKVEILRFRFLKEFDFDPHKLSFTFPKLKCVEYEKCPKLTNFPRNRSPWITKLHGRFPNGIFDDDEEVVVSPNSELSRPISDRSTRLELENETNRITAPLTECTCEVGLRLRHSRNFLKDRDGLDLVVVLDISRSMKGGKLAETKVALLFLISRLEPKDRLSIVTFDTIAKRQCRLFPITESFKIELEVLINSFEADGDTNTFDGLQMGLKVLKDRRLSSNRAVGIILVSGGAQTIRFGDAAKVPLDDVPVHTFGLENSEDSRVLKAIADNSIGGSFTDLPIWSDRADPLFRGLCEILGLETKGVTLTITPIEEGASIGDVCCRRVVLPSRRNDRGLVIVEVGSIYKDYSKMLNFNLFLPSTDKEHCTAALDISYSYDMGTGEKFESEPMTVYVDRKRKA